jgi:outer membrane immunogenic protein
VSTRWYQAAAAAAVLVAGATVSSPVFSADLYGPAGYYDGTPLPPQNVFEGWYLGGTVGGASVSYDLSPVSPSSVDSSGVLGGVIGGYSWQHGPFVLGVEGDFLATDIDGSGKINGGLNKVSPGIDTMADLRLRAGYAIKENVLLFGTFGGAWANADLPMSGPGGGFDEATFFGWSAGGGAEVALNPKWSARFDYQFTNFDTETASNPGGKVKFDPDANTFRGSVIYHF